MTGRAEPRVGWTDERIASLTEFWKQGVSATQIAKAMGGVSRNAVLGKVWRLGLPGRTKSMWRETNRLTRRAAEFRPAKTSKPPEMAPTPPPAPIKVAAFDALPGSSPRPWEERGSGCNWPIGGGLSCCQKVAAYGWCAAHVAAGRVPIKASQKDLGRSLRWYLS